MNRTVPQALRDKLVSSTLAKIQRDRDRATDQQVAHFLDYLAGQIFDSDLSIVRGYADCSIERRFFVPKFLAVTGERPRDYVRNLRAEAGEILLRETALNFSLIAELVGFSTGQAFSLAFFKEFGERPTEYRARLEGSETSEILDSKFWKDVRSGRMDENQALTLLKHIYEHQPSLRDSKPEIIFHFGEESFTPGSIRISTSTFERLKAQKTWLEIQKLPLNEQRQIVSQSGRFESSALFELLEREVVQAGRKNRTESVELAILALDAARAVETTDLSGKSSLWARAYACLGNAQRLDFELDAAARSFRLAREYLPSDATLEIWAEVLLKESALRWYRHEAQAGIELTDRVVEKLDEGSLPVLLAQAYLLRGILHRFSGNFGKATQNHSLAVELLSGENQPELSCGALYNVALCRYHLGQKERALEIIADLRLANESVDSRQFKLLADWLEGRIHLDEKKLSTARALIDASYSGFKTMHSKMASLVGLDLAIIHYQESSLSKSLELIKVSLPVLSKWKKRSGFGDLVAKLEHAVRTRLLVLDDLIAVRDRTQVIVDDPEARRDLNFTGIL